ncbi:AAA family ATPase [Endozoicomonas sp. ALB032]|uniref:AAA family ATPase n=1 Tax=Endozoicomonas sp. ALB032 TaxID=3403082 RepID=UPI003BB699B9
MKNKWLDFNDAPEQGTTQKLDAEEVKRRIQERLPEYLAWLFPNGKKRGQKFVLGNVQGKKGKSLEVELGSGLWHDFESGEGGDIISLTAEHQKLDVQRDFPEIIQFMADWLGMPSFTPPATANHQEEYEDLGHHTGKWDYHNAEGNLIACVYRYDTSEGKEFRPWDVKTRKTKAPNPRPLYNQPGIKVADEVLLVEGEKAAQALIDSGYCATTAMNGAKAPTDKTDWSPLKNKRVLVWPDHDEAGLLYAQQAAQSISDAGAASVIILKPPEQQPEKWDAADAVAEAFDIRHWLITTRRKTIKESVPFYRFGELLDDESPMPEDLLSPRILTPGGMLVLGGAPKVGKSDFLLNLLAHMSAGLTFLDMRPSRPLKVFYLQAEVQYHYLRERVKQLPLKDFQLTRVRENLVMTARLKLILNAVGLPIIARAIQQAFPEGPDVIVIDPIRNVFDPGPDGSSENDNNAMLFFLKERVEQLRDIVNPDVGIVLVHHTRKMSKRQLEEDPFQALSGAGSLRGYYTSGMLLFRPEELEPERMLYYELRNGPSPKAQRIIKKDGQWREAPPNSMRLAGEELGKKHDAERIRKREVIVNLIYQEALKGRVFTVNQFSEQFENQLGLGGKTTIYDRIQVLATKGYIKFFRDYDEYNLPAPKRSKLGYLCVDGMAYGVEGEALCSIRPTDFKCPNTGALLPVENPDVWVYQDTL